jgi:hypothetical protein
MDKTSVLEKIIFLPRNFYKLRNISIFNLLKQSGYFELYDQIDNADILQAVTENRDVINDWLTWSENKRVTEGWFFTKNENETYVVDYSPYDKNKKQIKFANAEEACCYFIKNEIDIIRNNE